MLILTRSTEIKQPCIFLNLYYYNDTFFKIFKLIRSYILMSAKLFVSFAYVNLKVRIPVNHKFYRMLSVKVRVSGI